VVLHWCYNGITFVLQWWFSVPNTDSYTQTIENLYDISYLVKTGRVGVVVEDGIPFLAPRVNSVSADYKAGLTVCLSVCLFVSLSVVCLSICLSSCLSGRLPVCFSSLCPPSLPLICLVGPVHHGHEQAAVAGAHESVSHHQVTSEDARSGEMK
jgi:hypothetical protein